MFRGYHVLLGYELSESYGLIQKIRRRADLLEYHRYCQADAADCSSRYSYHSL